MKSIKFKHISISNFCGIKQLDTLLYDRTTIKGQNAVGKSTIRNAVFWVLYNKLADGSAPDGIRPHDENGVDIDFIDITVTLTIEVDGREISLKKVQKQKWTKPRGGQEKRFDGNINEFEINDIPKKEKDYKDYIENIIPVETLMYCTNAMAFLGMDTKKRRAKLLSLENEFSDSDVVATDEKYAPLVDMLLDGTVDELIARSKKVIKAKNDELKAIPVRIDELEKQKADVDVAELELGRNALKEKIAENKAKQDDASKQYGEYRKLSDGIMELKFAEGDLVRKANENNIKARREIEDKISDKKFLVKQTEKTISDTESLINYAKSNIDEFSNELQAARDDWKAENERKFDDENLICPYCGQEYPADKKEQLKAEFENHKAEVLARITTKGNMAKHNLDKEKVTFSKLEKELPEHKESLVMLNNAIADLEKQLSELPTSIDISDTEEYKTIQKQIAEKKQALEKMSSAIGVREILEAEAEDLHIEYVEIEKQIAKADNNAKIDERIAELQAEQREVAQKIADEEKTLDLLEDFNRAKINLLTDRVNQHFEIIRWQMFKPQINGGYEQVCNPLINGTSYYSTLNHGNKILAEIDICRAFQKSSDVQLPIFIDDAESVDGWRIPQMENQLIILKRTDDKELKVGEE